MTTLQHVRRPLTSRPYLPPLLAPLLLWSACGSEPSAEPEPPSSPDAASVARPAPPDAAVTPRDTTPHPPPAQPAGWADDIKPREAKDLNPDPRVVEINLEARIENLEIRPGKKTPLWTYDGGIPGPLIRVRAGDRLIVNFTNKLPKPTTIHWHGLRIPVEMDGVPEHSQPPVKTGGTFRYDFIAPDPGLYWYHPHVDSAAQLGDGLYGPLLVEDPNEPTGLGDELVMVLSDLSVDEQGVLRPHDLGGDVATLFGREGEVLLVNGKVTPRLQARAGLRQRWRIVNAAKSRYFTLGLAGYKFVRIGGDAGLLSRPLDVATVVLTPGERADVLIVPTSPGSATVARWIPTERGYGSTFARPEEPLFRLQVAAEPAAETPPMPAKLGKVVEPLDLTRATPVEIKFTRNDVNGKFFLGVNGKPFGGTDHIHARLGETQVWTLVNTLDWAHPYHLHGFFFQVLDATGKPVEPVEWKDTVDVPAKKTTKVAVRYDDRPGMWMFHCHILDHADAGMMGMILLAR
jgi:FtsP/CotA-like multicopper oxidase with cupredoxin domain